MGEQREGRPADEPDGAVPRPLRRHEVRHSSRVVCLSNWTSMRNSDALLGLSSPRITFSIHDRPSIVLPSSRKAELTGIALGPPGARECPLLASHSPSTSSSRSVSALHTAPSLPSSSCLPFTFRIVHVSQILLISFTVPQTPRRRRSPIRLTSTSPQAALPIHLRGNILRLLPPGMREIREGFTSWRITKRPWIPAKILWFVPLSLSFRLLAR